MSDDTRPTDALPVPASPTDAAAPVRRDALATLERLRAATPGAEPVVLVSLEPPDDDAPETALDFQFRRLAGLFREDVEEVRRSWGDPHFFGTVEEEAFPGWSEALLLATWWHDEVVAFLAVHHDDDSLPLELRAGAWARAEIEERLMWKPPGSGGSAVP